MARSNSHSTISTRTNQGRTAASGPRQPGSVNRIALVIGNSVYDAGDELPRAVSDAVAISCLLRSRGYGRDDVEVAINKPYEDLRSAIVRFGERWAKLSAGSPQAVDGDVRNVAYVHFSGHGVLRDGKYYLLPAHAGKISR